MELPPPHVLLQLDAIIVAQRESDGARVVASKKARALSKRRAKREFVEEAYQKSNGKWANHYMFGSREFDDLDAYRAAKAQRAARRDIRSCVYL